MQVATIPEIAPKKYGFTGAITPKRGVKSACLY